MEWLLAFWPGGACTMNNQDPPALTGPSELAQSIAISVSP